jgi:CubicO group peptidase (beta-lactamase class C family)
MTATIGSNVEIDQLLAGAIERGDVTGVAAVAADRSGQIYSGAFGARKGSEPFTADTICWLASTTKAVVSVAALQLVERGELDLDAPLGTLLPELGDPVVLEGFDDAGVAVMRPARSAVTLRSLLTHTSGFGYSFCNERLQRYQEDNGLPSIIECREATLTTPLLFDPGSGWEYGISIDWVGKAIEAVSGQRIGDYLHDNILAPLGMRDTTYVLSLKHRQKLATMNARTPDGLVPIEFEIPQEPEFQMGGGGMYGSPSDYLIFLRMLLAGGTLGGVQILSRNTLDAARRNHIGELSIGPFPTYDPAVINAVDFLPGTTKKWSLLGMYNVEETPAGRSAGSLFWAGLSNLYYWVDWDKGNTGLIATQILPFADPVVLDLFEKFENLVRAH